MLFIIIYNGVEKLQNENVKLLANKAIKNIPETILMFAVVLGKVKFAPIARTSGNASNTKLPALKRILLSLL